MSERSDDMPDNPASLIIPPHSHTTDTEINKAIAQALGERKVRLTDRRLLIIYLLLVICGLYVFHHGDTQNHALARQQHTLDTQQRRLDSQQAQLKAEQQRFERVTTVTCSTLDGIVGHYDHFLDSLKISIAARPDLSLTVKKELIADYDAGQLPGVDCSKLATGRK